MGDGSNGHALNVAGIAIERRPPCTKTTWCVGFEGHSAPCMEIPREPYKPADFGPNRSKR